MSKIKSLFFLISSPLFCFSAEASLGDDVNRVLQQFFGSGQEPVSLPASSSEIDTIELQTPERSADISLFELDASSELPSDKEKIFEKILEEEQQLDAIADLFYEEEQKLENFLREKTETENNLDLLDKSLSDQKKQLAIFQRKYQDLEKKLEALTREKSQLNSVIRTKKEVFEEERMKYQFRKNSWATAPDMKIFRWLFSEKTVAEILEEERAQAAFEKSEKLKLAELELLKKKLENREKATVRIFAQIHQMNQDAALARLALEKKTQSTAEKSLSMDSELAKMEFSLTNLIRQRQEQEALLMGLYQDFEKEEAPSKSEDLTQDENSPITSPTPLFQQEEKDSEVLEFAFLQMPLSEEVEISGKFRDPAYEALLGRNHMGLDFDVPSGTDILAPFSGKVHEIGLHQYGYTYLILEHTSPWEQQFPGKFYTVYGHLSDILFNEGQSVDEGDIIAKSGGERGKKGSGSFSSGPHLHFEVIYEGEHLDPEEWIKP